METSITVAALLSRLLDQGNDWLAYTQGQERVVTALAVDGVRR